MQRFGDERYAPKLAQSIIEARQGTIISTTGELKEAIRNAFPHSGSVDKKQVIKRVF